MCGGQDSSCRKVTGSFRNVTVPLGYHKILDIPAGATFINVTERRASPNYLGEASTDRPVDLICRFENKGILKVSVCAGLKGPAHEFSGL